MPLDEVGIKAKAEVEFKKDAPDLQEVLAEWANNKTKVENQKERKAINDVLHQKFPNLTIIDFTPPDKDNAKGAAIVFDTNTQRLESRSVVDFKATQFTDLAKDDAKAAPLIAEAKKQDEQDPSAKALAKLDDRIIAAYSNRADERLPDKDSADTQSKEETKLDGSHTYEIKSGDSLWKIARQQLIDGSKTEAQPNGSAPSPKQVRDYTAKILDLNKEGPTAITNPNKIYTGRTLILPGNNPDDQSGNNPDDQSGKKPDDQSGKTPDDQSGNKPDDQSGKKPDNQPEQQPVVKSTNTELSKFQAGNRTRENPTISAADVASETDALTRNFDAIAAINGTGSDKTYVTKEKIEAFLKANPGHADTEALTKAAKDVVRIENSFDDDGFDSNGITKNDLQKFPAQEAEFEKQYQAQYYLETNFEKMAQGKTKPTIEDIQKYAASLPEASPERAAVTNVIEQMQKNKCDSVTRQYLNFAIPSQVDGYGYTQLADVGDLPHYVPAGS